MIKSLELQVKATGQSELWCTIVAQEFEPTFVVPTTISSDASFKLLAAALLAAGLETRIVYVDKRGIETVSDGDLATSESKEES